MLFIDGKLQTKNLLYFFNCKLCRKISIKQQSTSIAIKNVVQKRTFTIGTLEQLELEKLELEQLDLLVFSSH
jgi:hypothetical protein